MITEILGALIVLGAVLVLIMRRLLSKGKAKEKESVEVSASRLRYEIERSGDAVIGRRRRRLRLFLPSLQRPLFPPLLPSKLPHRPPQPLRPLRFPPSVQERRRRAFRQP